MVELLVLFSFRETFFLSVCSLSAAHLLVIITCRITTHQSALSGIQAPELTVLCPVVFL